LLGYSPWEKPPKAPARAAAVACCRQV
jgi:hypothetical protein